MHSPMPTAKRSEQEEWDVPNHSAKVNMNTIKLNMDFNIHYYSAVC